MGRPQDVGRAILSIPVAAAGLVFLGAALVGCVPRGSAPAATPTPQLAADRLLKPTLPAQSTMADVGSQVFWLYCLPCHGDRGQGLTDEFREVYPPEDRNCWTSGCHGKRPYENGFTLPVRVPPLIGPSTLLRFNTALELHDYIRQAMPWQDPGSLPDDAAWQVTAFLAREHGSDPINEPLDNARAARVSLHAHDVQAQTSADRPREAIWVVGSAILLIGLLVLAVGFFAHRARRGAA